MMWLIWTEVVLNFWCCVYCLSSLCNNSCSSLFKPEYDRTYKMHPAKNQISMGIQRVWSVALVSAWQILGTLTLATHWVHSEGWSHSTDAQADLCLCLVHVSLLVFVVLQLKCSFKNNLSRLMTKTTISPCAKWVAKDPSFLQADSKDPDQTGRMPRLIWVFTGRTSFCWFYHEAAHSANYSEGNGIQKSIRFHYKDGCSNPLPLFGMKIFFMRILIETRNFMCLA